MQGFEYQSYRKFYLGLFLRCAELEAKLATRLNHISQHVRPQGGFLGEGVGLVCSPKIYSFMGYAY